MKASSLKSALAGATGILVAVTLWGLFFPAYYDSGSKGAFSVRTDVNSLLLALRQYRSEYGVLPLGDQRDIMRSLLGDNPIKIVFLEVRAKQMSPEGYFLDPWGSAYQIVTSEPENIQVYSLGKNKTDEHELTGSDDICSWR